MSETRDIGVYLDDMLTAAENNKLWQRSFEFILYLKRRKNRGNSL